MRARNAARSARRPGLVTAAGPFTMRAEAAVRGVADGASSVALAPVNALIGRSLPAGSVSGPGASAVPVSARAALAALPCGLADAVAGGQDVAQAGGELATPPHVRAVKQVAQDEFQHVEAVLDTAFEVDR